MPIYTLLRTTVKTLQTSELTTKKFLTAIKPALQAYRSVAVSFVALVYEGQETVLSASVRLTKDLASSSAREFSTRSLRAAQLLLPATGEVVSQIIDAMTSDQGCIVGDHLLKLLPSSRGDYSAYHEHSSQLTNEDTKSIERLIIRGESKWTLINSAELDVDAELRRDGFDSLYDLLWDFGLNDSDDTYLEILASPLPLFSTKSQINGQHMRIVAHLPLVLSKELFRVSVRSANRSHRGTQRMIPTDTFKWAKADGYRIAVHEEEVDVGSVLNCRAIYAGTIYDETCLYDPATTANARRTIIETNDPGLKHLCMVLEKIGDGGNQWRNEFESLVTIVLHMLGFEAARVGGMRKLTDGPDIYASTRAGNLLVIECTTGSFNDEKLEKLLARMKKTEKKFQGAMLGPQSISALIVTPLTLEELDSCVEIADRKGVILLCGAQLREAIEGTRFIQNPDEILAEWRKAASIRSISSSFMD